MTPEEAIALAQAESEAEQPSIGMDILQSFGSGALTAAHAIPGIVGDIDTAAQWAGTGIGNFLRKAEGREPAPATPRLTEGIAPTTADVMEATGFEPYEPQTTAGEYARTVGEFLPAAALPGSAVGRIANVLGPSLGSETAGQLTEDTALEPYARVAGALAGGVAPSVAARAVTPFPTNPTRQGMVNTLKREGVDLTAGQTTGRHGLRYFESEMGGGKAVRFSERQGEQFTKAALKRAGINASRATPDVLDEGFSRIGQQFDDLAVRNDLAPVNHQLVDDLVGPDGAVTVYRELGGAAPIVEKTALDIGQRLAQNRVLSGDYYKTVTSRLARTARTANDPELKQALHGIRNALDDAMEQSIARLNPSDLGAWREARRQYRNILVIERAATGAGEGVAQGLISPSSLRSATVNVQGRRNYARGRGEFDELARAGEGTMKPLPQSGTAPRVRAQNLGVGLSTLLGAGVGGAAGGGVGGAAGALAGGLIPPLAGRAALSGPGRALLGNQAMSPVLERLTPGRAAIAGTLLESQKQLALPRP